VLINFQSTTKTLTLPTPASPTTGTDRGFNSPPVTELPLMGFKIATPESVFRRTNRGLDLTPGTGISVSGLTVTNTDLVQRRTS